MFEPNPNTLTRIYGARRTGLFVGMPFMVNLVLLVHNDWAATHDMVTARAGV